MNDTPKPYYGPQTSGEAIHRIDALISQGIRVEDAVERIASRMVAAGYGAETKRLWKYYRVKKPRKTA